MYQDMHFGYIDRNSKPYPRFIIKYRNMIHNRYQVSVFCDIRYHISVYFQKVYRITRRFELSYQNTLSFGRSLKTIPIYQTKY